MFQNSRCALSGAPLELPAVHFLCGHSFNARSLGDSERDCPLCAPQFRTILDIRASLRAGAAEQVPLGLVSFTLLILHAVQRACIVLPVALLYFFAVDFSSHAWIVRR